jgi:hypothetical protein
MDRLEQDARHLRKDWDSPDLWPRIAQALGRERKRPPGWPAWAMALAATMLIAIGASLLWDRSRQESPAAAAPQLLTEQALAELKSNETAYLESIDRLSSLAGPVIEMPPSPLVEAYRERLEVLDAAIAELRTEAGVNPLYGHLHAQLAVLYHEKQNTLEEVVKYAQ